MYTPTVEIPRVISTPEEEELRILQQLVIRVARNDVSGPTLYAALELALLLQHVCSARGHVVGLVRITNNAQTGVWLQPHSSIASSGHAASVASSALDKHARGNATLQLPDASAELRGSRLSRSHSDSSSRGSGSRSRSESRTLGLGLRNLAAAEAAPSHLQAPGSAVASAVAAVLSPALPASASGPELVVRVETPAHFLACRAFDPPDFVHVGHAESLITWRRLPETLLDVWRSLASTSAEPSSGLEQTLKSMRGDVEDYHSWLTHTLNEYRNDNRIERLFYPDHAMPFKGNFVQLTISQQQDNVQREASGLSEYHAQSAQRDVRGRPAYQEVFGATKNIELAGILQLDIDKSHSLRIRGHAGSGKTTLSKYLTFAWAMIDADLAAFNSWKETFSFVFRVPLRTMLSVVMQSDALAALPQQPPPQPRQQQPLSDVAAEREFVNTMSTRH
jgi:hypothetical protein